MRILDNPPLAALRSVMQRSTQSGAPLEVHLTLYSMKVDHATKTALALVKASTLAQQPQHRRRSLSFSSLAESAPCESPPRDYLDVPTPTAPTAGHGGALGAPAAPPAEQLDAKTLHYLISVLNAEFLDFDFGCGGPRGPPSAPPAPRPHSPRAPPAPPPAPPSPAHTRAHAAAATRPPLPAWRAGCPRSRAR